MLEQVRGELLRGVVGGGGGGGGGSEASGRAGSRYEGEGYRWGSEAARRAGLGFPLLPMFFHIMKRVVKCLIVYRNQTVVLIVITRSS